MLSAKVLESKNPRLPLVSIVVLTKNSVANIKRCLDGIYAQSSQNLEVIVLDSGSVDGTVKVVEGYPCRIYRINPQEFSHSRTRNLGWRLSRGKYVVFIVADAYPGESDWLGQMVAPFTDRKVALVFGRQLPKPGAIPCEAFFITHTYPTVGRTLELSDSDRPPEFVLNSDVSSAYRRHILQLVPFNEAFDWNEDQEIARRLLGAGYKIVYQASATVFHSHSYSLPYLFKRYFDAGRTFADIDHDLGRFDNGIIFVAKLMLGTIRYVSVQRVSNKVFWLYYSILYNLVKALGFVVGLKRAILPQWLQQRLSTIQ